MSDFIKWDSQSLSDWTQKYAKGKVIELDGHQTHYIEKGEGEPLILIHGFLYHSFMWQENIDELAKHYRVFAIDLWGCGYSTRAPLDFGYQLYSKQIKLFMQHLGLERAHFAGQSMGGGTAIQFTVENPDMAGKLILVNCAGMPNPQPFLAKVLNLPFIGEFAMSINTNNVRGDAIKDFFLYDKSLATREYIDDVLWPQKIEGSIKAGLYIQRKDFFDKLSSTIEQLATLNKQVLIVWGKQDVPVSVKRGEQMQAMLKGSQLLVLDKAGHVSNYEQAEQFNQAVVEFLGE